MTAGNAGTRAPVCSGLGVLQDFIEAHKWLNLAASWGDREAVQERESLAQKMTTEQVAEAQARALNWQSSNNGKVPANLPDSAIQGTDISLEESNSQEQQNPITSTSAATIVDSTTQGTGLSSEESILQQLLTPSAFEPAAKATETITSVTGTLSLETTLQVQELLTVLGYAPGSIDGVWGARTAQSYQTFLSDSGLPAAESVTLEAINAMRAQAEIQIQQSAYSEPSLAQQLLEPQSVATPSTSSPEVREMIHHRR